MAARDAAWWPLTFVQDYAEIRKKGYPGSIGVFRWEDGRYHTIADHHPYQSVICNDLLELRAHLLTILTKGE